MCTDQAILNLEEGKAIHLRVKVEAYILFLGKEEERWRYHCPSRCRLFLWVCLNSQLVSCPLKQE